MKQEYKLLIISSICLSIILVSLVLYGKINNKSIFSNSFCPIQEEVRIVKGNSLEPLVAAGSKVKALFGYYNCYDIKREDLVLYRYAGRKENAFKNS